MSGKRLKAIRTRTNVGVALCATFICAFFARTASAQSFAVQGRQLSSSHATVSPYQPSHAEVTPFVPYARPVARSLGSSRYPLEQLSRIEGATPPLNRQLPPPTNSGHYPQTEPSPVAPASHHPDGESVWIDQPSRQGQPPWGGRTVVPEMSQSIWGNGAAGCNCNGCLQGMSCSQHMSPDLVHGYVNDLLDGHYWSHPLAAGEPQGAPCGGLRWFGQANVLLLTRDRGKSVRLSTDDGVPASTVLSTDDVAVGWNEGLEFRLGRFIGCGDYAIEGAWWTMFRQRRQASVLGATLAGNLDSVIDFGELDFDQGGLVANVNDWYTASEVHRVRRGFEAHSVELNLLGFLSNGCASQCGSCDPCGHSFQLGWNLGFRYFRISEDLHFDTDDTNRTFGDPLGEVFYNIDLDNNLFGVQLGGNASYSFTSRLLATLDARVGLYGNYVQHSSSVIGCTIGPAVVNTGFHLGEAAVASTNEVDASMALELKLGTMYRISDHWTTNFGYRAVAISGLALPEDQIPFRFGDLQTIQNVDTHAAMILHGFNLGFEFWY